VGIGDQPRRSGTFSAYSVGASEENAAAFTTAVSVQIALKATTPLMVAVWFERRLVVWTDVVSSKARSAHASTRFGVFLAGREEVVV